MQHDAFVSGQFDTGFVKKYFRKEDLLKEEKEAAQVAALLGLDLYLKNKAVLKVPGVEETEWRRR